MKRRAIWVLVLALVAALIMPASAHPGRTDSNGGHWNRSTGEYHYHHGYPEHQHYNGECPYDFDDKTGQNSGSSSGGGGGGSYVKPKPTPTPTPKPTPTPTPEPSDSPILVFVRGLGFVILGLFALSFLASIIGAVLSFIESTKEKEKAQKAWNEERERLIKEYGQRDPKIIAGVPPDIEFDEKGLPFKKGEDFWGEEFTVYVSPTGKSFHLKRGCSGAKDALHIFYLGGRRPCYKCARDYLRKEYPWYDKYRNILRQKEKYKID